MQTNLRRSQDVRQSGVSAEGGLEAEYQSGAGGDLARLQSGEISFPEWSRRQSQHCENYRNQLIAQINANEQAAINSPQCADWSNGVARGFQLSLDYFDASRCTGEGA